jgi:predicted nucleic-acid-binding protein
MALAHSKLTAQGQISVPAEVRRRLGPGLLLDHDTLSIQDADVVQAAFAQFRERPRPGWSDCLMLQSARKAGHTPLGTFDRRLGALEGAQRL